MSYTATPPKACLLYLSSATNMSNNWFCFDINLRVFFWSQLSLSLFFNFFNTLSQTSSSACVIAPGQVQVDSWIEVTKTQSFGLGRLMASVEIWCCTILITFPWLFFSCQEVSISRSVLNPSFSRSITGCFGASPSDWWTTVSLRTVCSRRSVTLH